jgi:excisionase family DNA binding protein
MNDELTVKQAAKIARVTRSYIRRLASNGRLEARKLDGWQWLIDRRSFENWQETRRQKRQ